MNQITPVDALGRAIDQSGGQRSFSEKLSALRGGEPISPARVWNWINRDGGAPSDFCPDIEALTGIKCEDLRPDVNWAVLRNQTAKAA